MKNLAHVVTFFGKPGGKTASGVNYNSNDLRVIDTQLELIQRSMHDGVIVLWYGDVDPYINEACENFLFLCEKRQMLFALCVDPWAMGANKATMTVDQKNTKWTVLLGLAKPFFSSPAYIPEKYIIDFATGADIPTVIKQNPGFQILRTYVEVAWPKVSAGLDSKANLIQQNSTAIIPGVMHSFSDYDPKTPANSIWGGPARRIDGQDGLFELDVMKAPVGPQATYRQRITFNDYFERTHVERDLINDALRLGLDVTPLL